MTEKQTAFVPPGLKADVVPPDGETYLLDLRIYFVITVSDSAPEEASVTQGFAPSLCRHNGRLRVASMLPSTIYDLTKNGQKTLRTRRIAGINPVNWYCQSPRAVRSLQPPPMVPFNVILVSPEEDAKEYFEWSASCRVPPVIVAERDGEICMKDLNPETLRKVFLTRCDKLPETITPKDIETVKAMLSSWIEPTDRKIGYQVGGHNSVAPNVSVLASAGYCELVYGPFENINRGKQPYIDQIVQTANSVLEERRAVGNRDIFRTFRQTIDLNLFAPSIYPHIFQMPLPAKLNQVERKGFEQTLEALRRQEGYGFEFKNKSQIKAVFSLGPQDKEDGPKVPPRPHPLLLIRSQELQLGTEAVSALAVSDFSAVVRLPNDINRSAGQVRSFAQQHRAREARSRKRLLGFRAVQKRLADAVPPEFVDLVRRSETGVRIVADAHLEWLDVDGLPLLIRKDVCRIPVTPGNLFIETVGPRAHLRLTPADLHHILIIGALKRDDPIKRVFEVALESFSQAWRDTIRIDFVEVANEMEFVAAINAFDGQVVMFDGHGAHAEDSSAVLYLQEEPINVWTLRGRIARMPPIVILSACDTHAADRNHATIANGFLAIGARAVLASVFPLHANDAAVFAARLIYRLADFIAPAIKFFDRALTWLEIVSGMIRMQLLTDFLRLLEKQEKITHATYISVHNDGNMAINSGVSDPFAVVVDTLANTGLDRVSILKDLESAIAVSSVISYLHVGRPETILIDDPIRTQQMLE
ncbi:MAG: CHAT domain-containing protein [Magnetospirillum sp.]|nr:CHAT domain-containing protein [Magnetospirillum sp.]